MLKSLIRPAIVVLCVFVIAESLVLWNATNRDLFTRHYDPERAARDQNDQGLADLFGDGPASAETKTEPSIPPVPNEFRLGLLPSTYPWQLADKHLVSVLTLAGPAALIALLTLGSYFTDGRRASVRSSGRELNSVHQIGDTQ